VGPVQVPYRSAPLITCMLLKLVAPVARRDQILSMNE